MKESHFFAHLARMKLIQRWYSDALGITGKRF